MNLSPALPSLAPRPANATPSTTMRRARRLSLLYRWLWLGRLEGQTPRLTHGGLILAAHYNGAIDGFTYGSQLPPFHAVVSMQWHRTALGRFLLPGIPVERQKDGVKGVANLVAFRRIIAALQAGQLVLFFPEGTSRLGPNRLPIQAGTLLLLRQIRKACPDLPVYFCAADYRTPTCWGSAVSFGWDGPAVLPSVSPGDAEWISQGLLRAQAAAQAISIPEPSGAVRKCAQVLALPFLPVWLLVERQAGKTADDTNVIALWKFIYGVPITAVAWLIFTGLTHGVGLTWLPTVCLVSAGALWKR